jgi:hypothetical protein
MLLARAPANGNDSTNLGHVHVMAHEESSCCIVVSVSRWCGVVPKLILISITGDLH